MGISIGICGAGTFAQHFIPLIKAHPLVSRVVLCDLVEEKRKEVASRFGITELCPSLDKLVQEDVDAIALFTQNDRHAGQAEMVLRAGKHVYSAVPPAITLKQIDSLVRCVEATGKIYMLGETSYYYPCAIYCRERYRKGDFGYAVYGEGEYFHDWSHGMEQVHRTRFGEQWQKHVSMPSFFYPTHSVSMIVSVTGARVQRVSGMGVRHQFQQGETDFTKIPGRLYDNDFFNEVMLCQMSDGSVARFIEARRIGYADGPRNVGMSLYGSEGSFEQQIGSAAAFGHQCAWTGKTRESFEDVTALLSCPPASADIDQVKRSRAGGLGIEAFSQCAPIHPVHLLPKEYADLPNGHEGSHQFLIHEFLSACDQGRQPANNIWQAARYLAPGLIAHESAVRGGQLLDVPDWGDGSAIRKPVAVELSAT